MKKGILIAAALVLGMGSSALAQASTDLTTVAWEDTLPILDQQGMWASMNVLGKYKIPEDEQEARDVAYLASLVFFGTTEDPTGETYAYAMQVLQDKGYSAREIRSAGIRARRDESGVRVRLILQGRQP